MIPFDVFDWLRIGDIERCPYPPFRNHPKHAEWNTNDEKRLTLIALDRYADYLRDKNSSSDRGPVFANQELARIYTEILNRGGE